jgi:riboflavin kinase/FMN adenylyltransferase
MHTRSLNALNLEDAWLTIGVFDGVHRGHQAILSQLAQGAAESGVPAVVLTFDPHPLAILRPGAEPAMITEAEQRASYLLDAGASHVVTHPFDEQVANWSPEAFLRAIQSHINFSTLWVGYDFAMGKGRSGDIPRLKELADEMRFELGIQDFIAVGDEVISSSRIRSLIAAGQVNKVPDLTGRMYRLGGEVITGFKRGRTIGIPTANLNIDPRRAVPKKGVYICWAAVAGQRVPAVTNIGFRPTFDSPQPSLSVETHLLDFDADLYGQHLELDFVDRLRDEQKFDGIEALVNQIQADIQEARDVFEHQEA